jgi:hypothetical protein
MDNVEYALTKEEAHVLALECLTTRWPGIQWRLREVLERAFGWVFSTEATTEDTRMEQCRRVPPGLVLVNKRSGQVVATSRPHTPARFAKEYEVLLWRSQALARNWCSTPEVRRPGIAEQARRSGLEDISRGPT